MSAELVEGSYNPKLIEYSKYSFQVLNTTDPMVAMDLIREFYNEQLTTDGNLIVASVEVLNDYQISPDVLCRVWGRHTTPKEIQYKTLCAEEAL